MLVAHGVQAQADDEILTGPAYAKFRLTITSGWREEAAGPFYYSQNSEGQSLWAIPPFFDRKLSPDVDWSEWDFLYPALNYRRFGKEYRLQLAQIMSFSSGESQNGEVIHHTTLFPIYFRQTSTNPKHDYTALVPFGGHLENRLFRDDIKFIMFPLYSETRKKGKVTDNYLYPIFDKVRGPGLTGGQAWPFTGRERMAISFRTNALDEVETIGGYDKWFVMWPFYFNTHMDIGATNPVVSQTLVPFYSQTRSPGRDETSYGFPLGYNAIHDREKGYVEHDFIWPLFVWAHGSKTVTRYFPFYSKAQQNGRESIFYGFLLYKFNRLRVAALDRRRSRVLYCLYSDTVERNTETREFHRHVEFWPFFTYRHELDGTERWQTLAILEPLFPNNRTIFREYSQLWGLWRAEKNPHNGATSQSLLWNLYRRETVGRSKKASLFFGLFQYQSNSEGGRWRFCHFNSGRKKARAASANHHV